MDNDFQILGQTVKLHTASIHKGNNFGGVSSQSIQKRLNCIILFYTVILQINELEEQVFSYNTTPDVTTMATRCLYQGNDFL
jgi:hypothetical protein